MNPRPLSFRSVIPLLKDTASGWLDDGALRLSAALAYYSIFSIAPLLVIAIGLAGWFFGAEAVRGELVGQLRGMIGESSAKAVQSMVESASTPSKSMTATIIGVVTLLFGASAVFGQLKDALNIIWQVKPRSGLGVWPFVRERLLSFGMVLVIGFLLLTSLVLSAVLNAFNQWIERVLRLPDWLWGGAGVLLSLGIVTVLFAVIFKVLPDVKIRWRNVWVGAAVTALLFELGKLLLAWYLGRESTSSSYGAAGSVVLLLLWVYYASLILLFGAEFTKSFVRLTGERLEPSPIAQPMTAEDRTVPASAPVGPEPVPARESLPELFPSVYGRRAHLGERGESAAARFIQFRHSPAGTLATALGAGFLAGLVTRGRAGAPGVPLEPGEQARAGSRALALAALLALGKAGQWLVQQKAQPWLCQATHRVWRRVLRRVRQGA